MSQRRDLKSHLPQESAQGAPARAETEKHHVSLYPSRQQSLGTTDFIRRLAQEEPVSASLCRQPQLKLLPTLWNKSAAAAEAEKRRAATARELKGIPSQQEAAAALASPTPWAAGCWVFTDRVKRSRMLARLIPSTGAGEVGACFVQLH